MSTLKEQAKLFFITHREVYCPAFPNEVVKFNGKGLNHLFYKSARRKRSLKEIVIRTKMLPRAFELLEKSIVPQEEDQYVGKNDKVFRFWGFHGVIGNKLIKVIVRQVGNGDKHFWSAIPWWRKTRFGNKNSRSDLGSF